MDDDSFFLLTQNARVWILNAENEWILGSVEMENNEKSIVSTADVKVHQRS
jgi:hypothetical protein